MKVAVLLTLVLLVACEAKKSTGTLGRPVTKKALESEVTLSTVAAAHPDQKADCDQLVPDLDQIGEAATEVTASELLGTKMSYAALKSSHTILSDPQNRLVLLESRSESGYSQSCRNLGNQTSFELRYAAPLYFSLVNGAFGKPAADKAYLLRYFLRFDPKKNKGIPRASYVEKFRGQGSIFHFAERVIDMRGADVRFFRLANGELEIRTRKADLDSGLLVTFIARYEIKY